MNESFIQYIWKYKLFDQKGLKTTHNERLIIINTGMQNPNSGPDFFNARVKIGDTLWVGNIEIHLNSSGYSLHKHYKDKAYNNIVLHVVYNADKQIRRMNGEEIPTLELKNKINERCYTRYCKLIESLNWVACKNQLFILDKIDLHNWIDRMFFERLEEKANIIVRSLLWNEFDWEELCYQLIAKSFGAKINMEPFELMAKTIKQKILSKHKNNLFQIEALLFGQSGLLTNRFKDAYPKALFKEYTFLKKKYHLQSVKGHSWKFFKLRPSAFPHIRIVLFAKLVYVSEHLFSKLLTATSCKMVYEMFDVEASAYWENHFRFDQLSSVKRVKKLGSTAIQMIIINSVIPMLYVYGKQKGDSEICERTIKIMKELDPENNRIIRFWKETKIRIASAYESQALLQLTQNYCIKKRCLECSIGYKILRE